MTWLGHRPEGFWVTVIVLAVLAAGTVLSWVFWDWLRDGESGSSTVRNVGLLVGAIIAMVLAIWRSRVAGRQADTAERGLLNDRFQKGAEMLGSGVLAVRIGGIHGLSNLASEHPGQYHVQVMRLFCSFVRGGTAGGMLNEDAKAVLDAIGARRECLIRLERDAEYWLDLSRADLNDASLLGANLSSLELPAVEGGARPKPTCTDLSGANCLNANLGSANLKYADLSHIYLVGTNLSGVDLTDANLSGARFSADKGWKPANGLTQAQLDEARADPDNPPYLEGVVDAKTGKPLFWLGRPLKDDADGDC